MPRKFCETCSYELDSDGFCGEIGCQGDSSKPINQEDEEFWQRQRENVLTFEREFANPGTTR